VLAERLALLDPLERVAGASLGAVIGLLPVLVNLPVEAVIPAGGGDWLLVLGIGIGTSLLPMTVYAFAAPIAGAARTAAAGACELPTVFLIGWLLLGESLSWLHLVALTLIVVAIVVSPSRPARVEASPDAGRGVGPAEAVTGEHRLPQLQVAGPEAAR
jgi:drug/metabolite transporter (DMT)-like permease